MLELPFASKGMLNLRSHAEISTILTAFQRHDLTQELRAAETCRPTIVLTRSLALQRISQNFIHLQPHVLNTGRPNSVHCEAKIVLDLAEST